MADDFPKSKVDLCNLSLDLVKQGNITTIDDATNEAGACKRWYDTKRRALLRKYVWNFAKTDAVLNRLANVTPTGYADAYGLPGDILRFISIGDVFLSTKRIDYDLRSVLDGTYKKAILIENGGAAILNMIYVRNVEDVTEFDALFSDLLAHELAVPLARKFTAKPSLIRDIRQDLAELRLQAGSIDGQERPPVQFSSSRFALARRTGTRLLRDPTIQFVFPDGS